MGFARAIVFVKNVIQLLVDDVRAFMGEDLPEFLVAIASADLHEIGQPALGVFLHSGFGVCGAELAEAFDVVGHWIVLVVLDDVHLLPLQAACEVVRPAVPVRKQVLVLLKGVQQRGRPPLLARKVGERHEARSTCLALGPEQLELPLRACSALGRPQCAEALLDPGRCLGHSLLVLSLSGLACHWWNWSMKSQRSLIF